MQCAAFTVDGQRAPTLSHQHRGLRPYKTSFVRVVNNGITLEQHTNQSRSDSIETGFPATSANDGSGRTGAVIKRFRSLNLKTHAIG
jgi:hypothetical protein